MSRTKRVALCALFTALLVVSGFVRIPTPVIAITLQVQVALLAGVLLGGEWGALSALVYTALGLIGLPVFAYGEIPLGMMRRVCGKEDPCPDALRQRP